jgi:hypothetical protein
MRFENCALDILDKFKPGILPKVYEKFPQVDPKHPSNQNSHHIYISMEELEQIVKKIAKVKVSLYTDLGARYTSQPWKVIGYKNWKNIPMRISESHATMIASKYKVDAIEYAPITYDDLQQTNLIGEIYQEPDEDLNPNQQVLPVAVLKIDVNDNNNKKRTHQTTITMKKTYRPSSFTGNPQDDSDLKYANCQNDSQLLYKIFQRKFNITPTIPEYSATIKQAEIFPTRGREEQIPRSSWKSTTVSRSPPRPIAPTIEDSRRTHLLPSKVILKNTPSGTLRLSSSLK